MATVSVVIPSRDDAGPLAGCLGALAVQSRRADEIIVVDNNSTDDTAALCLAAGVRRIQGQLPGIPASTACGFDAASSDVIARLDADSRPPPDWLERIEAVLGSPGGPAAVTGPADFYGGSRLVCWLGRVLYLGGYFRAVGALLGHPPLFGSNFAMRAEVWARSQYTVIRDQPRIHDDLDISYHLRPDMTVFYDRRLRVAVSARPFATWRTLGRRLGMACTTFRVEFGRESPLRRRQERWRWARTHGR